MTAKELRRAAAAGDQVVGLVMESGFGGCQEVEHIGVPRKSTQNDDYSGKPMWRVDARLFRADELQPCPDVGSFLKKQRRHHRR